MNPFELDKPCVNTIRFLSVDMVEKANSGLQSSARSDQAANIAGSLSA